MTIYNNYLHRLCDKLANLTSMRRLLVKTYLCLSGLNFKSIVSVTLPLIIGMTVLLSSVSFEAQASAGSYYNNGEQLITYFYTVTNSGNVTIKGPINVTDDHLASTFTISNSDLAPGQNVTGSAIYTITQQDLKCSFCDQFSKCNRFIQKQNRFSNTANATVTIVQHPALTITKTPNPTTYTDGQSVTYTYTVKNTGNVTLSNISVVDSLFGTVTNLSPTTLGPGAQATGIVTYPTTQGDYDHGSVNNTATVYNGSTPLNQTQATITAINQNPALTLTKIPNPSTYNDGQSVLYTYTVTNVGNVTLSSVNVTDTTFGQTIVLGTTTLAPDASTTGTFTYTTTQTDFDNGSVVDNALAEGTFKSIVVQAPASATVTAVNQAPVMNITKKASRSSDDCIGEVTFSYTYTVTNTGSVDIPEPITVHDNKIPAGQITISTSGSMLAPGQNITGTATYSTYRHKPTLIPVL